MATTETAAPPVEKDTSFSVHDGVPANNNNTHHHHNNPPQEWGHERGYGHGYGPGNAQGVHPAFGGALHPGLYRPYEHRRFANPAPLGLCAFALTTFVLSAINMEARGVKIPNVVVPLAFGYGGLVQLLAGMWEMAVGNTFGATALSSYGGFWIAYGILNTPAWGITDPAGPYEGDTHSAVGFFLTGWFIFNTLLLLCTLRSTVAFFLLFFTLDLAFLFLACENFAADNGNMAAAVGLKKAGGFFGFLAAFLAWYNALAGLQDSSNSFFTVHVVHFPWSDKGREIRAAKVDSNTSAATA